MTLRRINTAEMRRRPRAMAWTSISSRARNERSICLDNKKKLWNVFICVFSYLLLHVRWNGRRNTSGPHMLCSLAYFLYSPEEFIQSYNSKRSLVLEQVSVAPARHYCICSLWNTHLTGFRWGNATFSNRLDYLECFRTGFVFSSVWKQVRVKQKKKKGGKESIESNSSFKKNTIGKKNRQIPNSSCKKRDNLYSKISKNSNLHWKCAALLLKWRHTGTIEAGFLSWVTEM